MLNIFSSCSLEMSTLMLRFDNKTPYIKQTKMDINKLKIIVDINQVEKIKTLTIKCSNQVCIIKWSA